MSEFEVAVKAAQETEILQKARRDFDALKKDEEKYLTEREEKANTLLAGLTKKAESARELLGKLADKAKRQVGELGKRMTVFITKLTSLTDRTGAVLKEADRIKERAEETLEIYQGLIEKVNEKITALSEQEKTLRKRETQVEKRGKEAEAKLQEAKDLAYWHKTGKRYVENNHVE